MVCNLFSLLCSFRFESCHPKHRRPVFLPPIDGRPKDGGRSIPWIGFVDLDLCGSLSIQPQSRLLGLAGLIPGETREVVNLIPEHGTKPTRCMGHGLRWWTDAGQDF